MTASEANKISIENSSKPFEELLSKIKKSATMGLTKIYAVSLLQEHETKLIELGYKVSNLHGADKVISWE